MRANRKFIVILALIFCFMFASTALAAATWWDYAVYHHTVAEFNNGKANYTSAVPRFDRMYLDFLTDENDILGRWAGTVSIKNGTYAYRCVYADGTPTADSSVTASDNTFNLGCTEVYSNESWYYPYPAQYTGTPNVNAELYFYGPTTEAGLAGKTVEVDGIINGTDSWPLPNFKSTSAQMAEGVPYFEFVTNAEGKVTGAKWRGILPSNPNTALVQVAPTATGEQYFAILAYIRILTKDGVYHYLRKSPTDIADYANVTIPVGSPIEGTLYVAASEAPINISDIDVVRIRYQGSDTNGNYTNYVWLFNKGTDTPSGGGSSSSGCDAGVGLVAFVMVCSAMVLRRKP